MGSKRFPLAEGEPDRLEVRWRGRFRDVVVSLDGKQLHPEPFSPAAIGRGEALTLPDGSRLFVSLDRRGLAVALDHQPLPGSANDPKTAARSASRNAAAILWVIAGFTLLLEVFIFFDAGIVDWPGLGLTALFGVLGYLVLRGSLPALWVGIGAYALDSVVAVIALLAGVGSLGGLAIRVFFMIGLLRSIPGMRQLSQVDS